MSYATKTDRAFALYVPVGPGEEEPRRAADAIDSVAAYNDGLRWVILVDDGSHGQALADVCRVPDGCRLAVLPNPREGIGSGVLGGLCVADLVALNYVHARTDARFTLKMDTDALALGTFDRDVAGVLASRPDAGLLGTIGDSFGENRTTRFIETHRQHLELALSLPDDGENLNERQQAVVIGLGVDTPEKYPSLARALRLLRRAEAGGHPLGEYCQGGAYIVSRRLIDAMAEGGELTSPVSWRDLRLGEDLMMALQCGAAGLRIYDALDCALGFAVGPGCGPLSRLELAASQYTLVHSIRGRLEPEFRAFFHERRALARQ